MVYVINIDGTPLMPTERYGKVRRMLNEKKAKVVNRRPFTIQLLYETTGYVQPVKLGVDASNKVIGLSACTDKKEVYASEVELRKDVPKLLEERKRLRQLRRRRKNRKSRPNIKKGLVLRKTPYYVFENMRSVTKSKVRIKPTMRQKLDSHIGVINRVAKMIPIRDYVIETGQYSEAILDKSRLHGKDELYDFNRKNYVLFRDHHTCQWCKGRSKGKILVTRSIDPESVIGEYEYHKSKNHVTLCKKCATKFDELRKTNPIKLSKITPRLKSHVIDNEKEDRKTGLMRKMVFKTVQKYNAWAENMNSYMTKLLRHRLGLNYSPINNARVMIRGTTNFQDFYYYMKLRRNHNRQLQRVTPLKNSGLRSKKSPYYTKGFASYDLVKYNDKEYYITKKRKSGYFGLGLADGTTLINSVKWDKIKLLQRRKSYSVEARYC